MDSSEPFGNPSKLLGVALSWRSIPCRGESGNAPNRFLIRELGSWVETLPVELTSCSYNRLIWVAWRMWRAWVIMDVRWRHLMNFYLNTPPRRSSFKLCKWSEVKPEVRCPCFLRGTDRHVYLPKKWYFVFEWWLVVTLKFLAAMDMYYMFAVNNPSIVI